MITGLLVLSILITSSAFSQKADLRMRIPVDVGPGVYLYKHPANGDSLVLETTKKIEDRIKEERLQEWVGTNSLHIVVSRMRTTEPIRVEVQYLTKSQQHSFVTIFGENVVNKGINEVFRKIAEFPRGPRILRTTGPVAHNKAQPRRGLRFSLIKNTNRNPQP